MVVVNLREFFMDQILPGLVRTASSDDFKTVTALLQSESLPVEDIRKDLAHFFVIEGDNKIIAAGGLEVYGNDGLVRSMIVDRDYRNHSLAAILLNKLQGYAAEQGITALYLITTTAEGYFAKKGFKVIAREEVSSSLASSREFSMLCPSTATVMMKEL